MQCPVCKCETMDYVSIPEIVPSLHAPLFDVCTYWQYSPGVCRACIDALDMQTDPILQSLFHGTGASEHNQDPFVFKLSEQEYSLWCHEVDHIRLWFRSDMRRKVKTIAFRNQHLIWSIVDENMVLLDYGEIPYDS